MSYQVIYNFINIIEADLSELLQMSLSCNDSEEVEHYCRVLISYFRGDTKELKYEINRIKEKNINKKYDCILLLSELRLAIRTMERAYLSKILESDVLNREMETQYKAELYFLMSSAANIINNQKLACEYSRHAASLYKIIGAKRKVVRSLLNAFSLECSFKPKKNYLTDLYFIYSESKKVGDIISIGGTLGNISREYQKMGLFDAALKYANRAIALYTKHSPGGLDYHIQLIHRAHLHLEMGAFREARIDCEMGLACSFPAAHAAINLILTKFPDFTIKPNSASVDDAPFNWKIKSLDPVAKKTSKHESILFELLMKRPYSKIELCTILYGNKIDQLVAENRLQNLLSRIKKWNPKLIICHNSKYFLSESPTVPILFKSVTNDK